MDTLRIFLVLWDAAVSVLWHCLALQELKTVYKMHHVSVYYRQHGPRVVQQKLVNLSYKGPEKIGKISLS